MVYKLTISKLERLNKNHSAEEIEGVEKPLFISFKKIVLLLLAILKNLES